MSEVTKIETAVDTEVKDAVTDVVKDADAEAKKLAEELTAELDKAEPAVKAEVAGLEASVAKVAKRAIVTLDAADKAAIRDTEVEYLRASQQVQHLQQILQNCKTKYEAQVASFVKKYETEGTHIWEEITAQFVSLENRLEEKLRSL